MKIKQLLILLLAASLLAVSCSKDDDDEINLPSGDFANGILVSNEGPFNNGSGTVTFISENLGSQEDAIYKKVNGEDLGNVVQSIGFNEDHAYIISNVSRTVTVVDRYTFEKITDISDGFENPRYFVAVNGKGYVTDWGDPNNDSDDYVAVIDLATNAVQSTISVNFGPERLLAKGNAIYVAHQGGYGQNDIISVINTDSNTVTATIQVGSVPNSLQLDDAGNLWVLSAGTPSYAGTESGGVLSMIDTSSNTVTAHLDFETSEHPNLLSVEGSILYYYLNGSVYEIDNSALTLPGHGILDGVNFYAMSVSKGKLYGTNAGDFASRGTLAVYDLNSKANIKTMTVGIVPGGVYFN
ncbi:YncE family protein [Flavobacteriaceae bacterium F89]|uniref:YncE family protein n=1 Tax=Cerina litoralis TaxID=2874477 RepID=A0AAE3EXB9_9FLAO|nr:DUF5074 domain-containing protein [Cerina litoralis]MCG2462034.1 YncE family protein [Cerina litoralis]